MKKIIWIVVDSVGIGALPDSEKFGDLGVNTIGNIIKKHGDINIPNMLRLGIGNISGVNFLQSVKNPIGCFGKCKELSMGKDTTTGHWEMTGVIVDKPFKTFHNGFPREIIQELEKKIGRKVVGNKPASGTEIIEELGEHQMKTGDIIVYTSADSVFQIAAHEEIIPLKELYSICKIARKIMSGDNAVARIIARPYIGSGKGHFVRTANRKDFSVDPYEDTVLDYIKIAGLDVVGIGKISDIFNGKGITKSIHTLDNMDGINKTIEIINSNVDGLIFTNLVDFDSKFGHRRDSIGYKNAIEQFDKRLTEVFNAMSEKDILIINADHGNDPTYRGTDHTREYIPLLVYGKCLKSGVDLGVRDTFADIGKTISQILNVQEKDAGKSFISQIY